MSSMKAAIVILFIMVGIACGLQDVSFSKVSDLGGMGSPHRDVLIGESKFLEALNELKSTSTAGGLKLENQPIGSNSQVNISALNISQINFTGINASTNNRSEFNLSANNSSDVNASAVIPVSPRPTLDVPIALGTPGSSFSLDTALSPQGLASDTKSAAKGFWSMEANKHTMGGNSVHSKTTLSGNFDVEKTTKFLE
jgi:hypothetical protein